MTPPETFLDRVDQPARRQPAAAPAAAWRVIGPLRIQFGCRTWTTYRLWPAFRWACLPRPEACGAPVPALRAAVGFCLVWPLAGGGHAGASIWVRTRTASAATAANRQRVRNIRPPRG